MLMQQCSLISALSLEGGSPMRMCGCCSTLLVLHYLWTGEPHMHTQFMGVCSSTLLHLSINLQVKGSHVCAVVLYFSCWRVRITAALRVGQSTRIELPPTIKVQRNKQWRSLVPLVLWSSPTFSMWFLSRICCAEAIQLALLSLKGNVSKYRYTFYVFLGGGKLSILCCYLGPISLHQIFNFK